MHDTAPLPAADQVISLIRRRAENLYSTRQLLCSEAVLTVLNEGLRGGLSAEHAISLASAFPVGLGDSGCLCGAVSGGVLALGLFLGREKLAAGDTYGAQTAAHTLHDEFKELYGATCCRVLSRKVKDDLKAHFRQCATLTGVGAELAARIILERRPELVERANLDYLSQQDSWLGSRFKRLANAARR